MLIEYFDTIIKKLNYSISIQFFTRNTRVLFIINEEILCFTLLLRKEHRAGSCNCIAAYYGDNGTQNSRTTINGMTIYWSEFSPPDSLVYRPPKTAPVSAPTDSNIPTVNELPIGAEIMHPQLMNRGTAGEKKNPCI